MPHWAEGQSLLVEVLRAGPPLEVRVLGHLSPWGRHGPAEVDGSIDAGLPALRPDQAAILRLAAASTDTMAQAAHWRQLSLAALQLANTVASAPAIAAPFTAGNATGPVIGPVIGPVVGSYGSDGVAPNDAAQLLRMLPWHGWPLSLWLEQRRGARGQNRRARRRAGVRLCLALGLPQWGQVVLVLDVLDVQVGLTLITTEAASVGPLRAQVSAMVARLARAGLRLMRCQVRHLPGVKPPTTAATQLSVAEHELPLALFRAGSEVLEVLRHGTGTTEGDKR